MIKLFIDAIRKNKYVLPLLLFLSCSSPYEIDSTILELFMDEIPDNHLSIYLSDNKKNYFFGDSANEIAEELGISLAEGTMAFETNWLKSHFEEKGYTVVFKEFDLRNRDEYEKFSKAKRMYIDFSEIYCNDKTSKCLLFAGFVCGQLCGATYYFVL